MFFSHFHPGCTQKYEGIILRFCVVIFERKKQVGKIEKNTNNKRYIIEINTDFAKTLKYPKQERNNNNKVKGCM